MKFSAITLLSVSLSSAFSMGSAFTSTPYTQFTNNVATTKSSTTQFMALDMDAPPAVDDVKAADNLPVLQSRGGAPVDVRYSDFLKLVNADRVEKVTFSADGTKLLGVDTDGVRIKIDSLPNDPSLLNELTSHKVRKIAIVICVSEC